MESDWLVRRMSTTWSSRSHSHSQSSGLRDSSRTTQGCMMDRRAVMRTVKRMRRTVIVRMMARRKLSRTMMVGMRYLKIGPQGGQKSEKKPRESTGKKRWPN